VSLSLRAQAVSCSVVRNRLVLAIRWSGATGERRSPTVPTGDPISAREAPQRDLQGFGYRVGGQHVRSPARSRPEATDERRTRGSARFAITPEGQPSGPSQRCLDAFQVLPGSGVEAASAPGQGPATGWNSARPAPPWRGLMARWGCSPQVSALRRFWPPWLPPRRRRASARRAGLPSRSRPPHDRAWSR
jgi:hypothetical protein